MRTGRRRQAFTVVELLVVMAIIIAFAGVVFAALGPAREKARQGVCMSNLGQIGKAVSMYRADYEGADVSGSSQTVAQLGLPRFDTMLDPYIKNRAVFRCPNEDWTAILGTLPGKMSSSYYWGTVSDEMSAPIPFSRKVALRGDDAVLAACPHHDPTPREPRGDHTVVVLRLSGTVQRRVLSRSLDVWRW
jgi:type II secretory pathway pseudopilin PulG